MAETMENNDAAVSIAMFQEQLKSMMKDLKEEMRELKEEMRKRDMSPSKRMTSLVSQLDNANNSFFEATKRAQTAPQISLYDGDSRSAVLRVSREFQSESVSGADLLVPRMVSTASSVLLATNKTVPPGEPIALSTKRVLDTTENAADSDDIPINHLPLLQEENTYSYDLNSLPKVGRFRKAQEAIDGKPPEHLTTVYVPKHHQGKKKSKEQKASNIPVQTGNDSDNLKILEGGVLKAESDEEKMKKLHRKFDSSVQQVLRKTQSLLNDTKEVKESVLRENRRIGSRSKLPQKQTNTTNTYSASGSLSRISMSSGIEGIIESLEEEEQEEEEYGKWDDAFPAAAAGGGAAPRSQSAEALPRTPPPTAQGYRGSSGEDHRHNLNLAVATHNPRDRDRDRQNTSSPAMAMAMSPSHVKRSTSSPSRAHPNGSKLSSSPSFKFGLSPEEVSEHQQLLKGIGWTAQRVNEDEEAAGVITGTGTGAGNGGADEVEAVDTIRGDVVGAHTTLEWQNELARHILSMYATTNAVSDLSTSKSILEFVDPKRTDNINTVNRHLLSGEGHFDLKHDIVSSKINAAPSGSATGKFQETSKSRPKKRKTGNAKEAKLAREKAAAQDAKRKVEEEENVQFVRGYDGQAVPTRPMGPPRCFPVWFVGTSDIYSDWSALSAFGTIDGVKLTAQLKVMSENREFWEYLCVVEAALNAYLKTIIEEEETHRVSTSIALYSRGEGLKARSTTSPGADRVSAGSMRGSPAVRDFILPSSANSVTNSNSIDSDSDTGETRGRRAAAGKSGHPNSGSHMQSHSHSRSRSRSPEKVSSLISVGSWNGGSLISRESRSSTKRGKHKQAEGEGEGAYEEWEDWGPGDQTNFTVVPVEDDETYFQSEVATFGDDEGRSSERQNLSVFWLQMITTGNAMVVLSIEDRNFDLAMNILHKLERWSARSDVLDLRQRRIARGLSLDSFSYYFYRRKKYHAAMRHTKLALDMHEKAHNDDGIACSILQIAAIQTVKGMLLDAHKTLYQFLAMIEEGRLALQTATPKQLCLVAIGYHNLAVVQLKMQHSDLACKSSQNARKIARLCLSCSTRYIATFQNTHDAALKDLSYHLKYRPGPAGYGDEFRGSGLSESQRVDRLTTVNNMAESFFKTFPDMDDEMELQHNLQETHTERVFSSASGSTMMATKSKTSSLPNIPTANKSKIR